jgi:hypothetical protein
MAAAPTKVIFLHIPKTAGQSVHAALTAAYGASAICPARVNEQLFGMTVAELNNYQVFSGHLDWSLLDCVRGPRFAFTVLREPRDRILSFYFFLRAEAAGLTPAQLAVPHRKGMRAMLQLSPDEYFCAGPPDVRGFLDSLYDNFYTYFFAGRFYLARAPLNGRVARRELTHAQIVDRALANLATLDGVYRVADLDIVFTRIRELSGAAIAPDADYRVNVNANIEAGERVERLRALGATEATFARIDALCRLDNELWQRAPFATALAAT